MAEYATQRRIRRAKKKDTSTRGPKSKSPLKKRKVKERKVRPSKTNGSEKTKMNHGSPAKKDTIATSPIKTPKLRPRYSKNSSAGDADAGYLIHAKAEESAKIDVARGTLPGLPWIDSLSSDNQVTPVSKDSKPEEAVMKGENLFPFNWEPNKDATSDPVSSKETYPDASKVASNLHKEIKYDEEKYRIIYDSLTACPDFNNKNEYVIRNDGMTRTALGTSALMRARIKAMLQNHENLGWWKCINTYEVSAHADEVSTHAEHLVALAMVMYDVTGWSLVSVGDGNDFTPSKFDEEDDILHIGQLMADLWERVDRSLSRDKYSTLGPNGLERAKATNMIIGIIVGSSRMTISGLV